MAKGKRNNRFIIILVVAIVGLLGLLAWKNNAKPKGEKVSAEEVKLRTIKEKVAASGKVFPQTEVKISSDVSGEIVELFVEEGDSVKMGQLLAKIDPDAYVSQVERGEAGVNSSKANLANSKSQVKNLAAQKEQIMAQLENAREIHTRNDKLKKDGVISDADFEASFSNLKALQANLRSADAGIEAAKESVKAAEFTVKSSQATLKELKTSLNRTTIYAPMGGVISRLDVEQGERVVGTIQMQGTEMMRIANLNAMEVRVDVSENDITRVSLGDEVEIEVDAYLDRTFKGFVTQIANSATATGTTVSLTSDQVTNFEVRISIDPASYADLISPVKPFPFRPGMSSSVEINTQTDADVLSIPIQAVTTRDIDGDKKDSKAKKGEEKEEDEETTPGENDMIEVVFRVSTDTVDMVVVKTDIQDDTYIKVIEGLKEGDMVVTAPYSSIARKLKEGDRVRVVEESELFTKK